MWVSYTLRQCELSSFWWFHVDFQLYAEPTFWAVYLPLPPPPLFFQCFDLSILYPSNLWISLPHVIALLPSSLKVSIAKERVVVNNNSGPHSFFFPGYTLFRMWLYTFSHAESIFPPLESGLALWLALDNDIYKEWCAPSWHLKRFACFHLVFWKTEELWREQIAQACGRVKVLLKQNRAIPTDTKLDHPAPPPSPTKIRTYF